MKKKENKAEKNKKTIDKVEGQKINDEKVKGGGSAFWYNPDSYAWWKG